MEFITLSQEVYLLIFFTSALTQISYVSSQTTTQIDYVTSSAYTQCPGGQTLCADGSSCYYSVGRCDGIPDCNDGSDETNCPTNTLLPSCPEQQKRCPDGSCINPINDCPELSVITMITSALSSLDAQSPGTTETVLASSSSIVTSRSLLTDVELSTSVHSSSHSLTSKQTDVTSSLQTRPEEATRTHSEDIRSTHAYSEDIRSTRAYSEEFQSTRTYSEQIQLTQASKYQSVFNYNSFLSTDEIISSMSSVHTSDTTDMPSVSSFTKTEFISPSVSITTQTQSSVFVTSDISPTSTIQSSATIMSSSYYTTKVINENVTSSFKWPLSTSSDNIKLSTSITDEITTPSLQTPSLTIKPTETVKTNSTILQSHTEDILPTRTINSLDTSSSIRMNATFTTPFSTIAPPVDTPFPPWIIAVIVCGSVLVLFIIVCICVVCSQKRKRTHKLPYKDPDDIGYRSSTVKRPIYDYHYDNRLIYQQPSIPRPIVDNYITARNLKNSDFRNINE